MATLKEEDGIRGRWVYYEYKVRGKTYLARTRRDFIRENNDVENKCDHNFVLEL